MTLVLFKGKAHCARGQSSGYHFFVPLNLVLISLYLDLSQSLLSRLGSREALIAMATKKQIPYEPKARFCHYAAAVGGQCLVVAGRTTDGGAAERESFASTVEAFDPYLEKWKVTATKTKNKLPTGLYGGGCCVSPSGDVYVYGGGVAAKVHGGLYKLTSNSEWSQLAGESLDCSPMKKTGARMVFFGCNNLAVIGGRGLCNSISSSDMSSVVQDRRIGGHGWTNEAHIFDIAKGTNINFSIHLPLTLYC